MTHIRYPIFPHPAAPFPCLPGIGGFKYLLAGAYLLDYSQQKNLHFDETACRNLTGYRNTYLLDGGLQAGLDLWDKNDLDVYDREVLPANLEFLSSIPVEEIPRYLFECTYRVRNKSGEIKTISQKSFFLHATDNKLPTLVCGYLYDTNNENHRDPFYATKDCTTGSPCPGNKGYRRPLAYSCALKIATPTLLSAQP